MIAVGETLPPRSVGPVSQTDIVRFAGASGDFNPLHHDPAAARAAGFDAPIAMGQFQAAALAGLLSDWAGVGNVLAYAVRFRAPVRLGDVLELSGEVVAVESGVATVDLVGRVGSEAVVTATARVGL